MKKNIPKIRKREGNEKIHSHNSGMGIRGFRSWEWTGTGIPAHPWLVSLFLKESVVNRFSDQYFGRFAIDNWLPGSAGSQGHWDEPKSNLPSYWERLFQIQLYFIINVISKLSPYVTFNNIRILSECWLTFRKCLQVLRVHYIHPYGVSYKFQNTGMITIPNHYAQKNWVQHEFL